MQSDNVFWTFAVILSNLPSIL